MTLMLATLLLVGCQQTPKLTLGEEQSKLAKFARSAELGMVEYTVVKAIKADDVPQWYQMGDRKILFNCKATLKAGIDMSKFNDSDVKINQATKDVQITLPAPKLLNLDIKPDDVKLMYENVSMFRKGFSASDRNKLLAQGEKDIRESVGKMGILEDAQKNAQLYFDAMLKQMGYKSVSINFKKEG